MAFFRKWRTGDTCEPLPALDAEQTNRYRRFRRLLEHNRTALTLQADLEQIYYDNRPFMPQMVERKSRQLLLEVDGMVNALSGMTGKDYEPLFGILRSIERSVQREWSGTGRRSDDPLVLPLAHTGLEQISLIGAKAANLAHVASVLQLPIPQGFALTTAACRTFMQESGLCEQIDALLAELIDDDPARLEAASHTIGKRILATPLPARINQALQAGAAMFSPGQLVAVRSSAIGEDGEISFAGQYSSVLNVAVPNVGHAYRQVIASLYSASALSYRMHHGLDDRETPMGVLVLAMVQPHASGVLYTADPTNDDRDCLKISAVAGLGDQLVGGDASPEQMFLLQKSTFALAESGGQGAPAAEIPEYIVELAGYALRLEAHYRRPLDIEWAVDASGRVFILQVRPLIVLVEEDREEEQTLDYPGHPVLIEGGKCAAGGVVTGKVLLQTAIGLETSAPTLEPDTILVTRTASTTFTPWVSKVKGIVTDIGGTASHLASVAREFGVPALFDTGIATNTLKDGDEITLWASQGRVYQGAVQELARSVRQVKRPIFNTPAHLRLQRLLDLVSPLSLTDSNSADFKPEKCLTVHDIIRYCHELSVRQMFNLGETIGRTRNAVRLKVNIPITLYGLDMGGGLRPGLTTCDEINAHDVVSGPFVAIWRGFSYPGINWSSAVAGGAQDFLSLMAAGARTDNSRLGGASYAILSGDYVNLNVRFGYHFATVDALCSHDIEHNYVSLSFAGGAGAYHGRSLRIQFLAGVLSRLGFETTITGDLIQASLMRLDQPAMEIALDQLGRLLGASRLLDMALKTPEQVVAFTESFFQGKYDFLEPEETDAPANFFLITGDWRAASPEGEATILQDGSRFVSSVSVGLTQAMARIMGKRYQEFLDNIEAYCYFPLIIARESEMGDGAAEVSVKPLSGIIDQAGGLAFAIRDWANYFVLRINALEDNAILFEFRNGKRFERQSIEMAVPAGQWHRLRVEIQGRQILGVVDDHQLISYQAERHLHGYIGLWTKADSITMFDDLVMQPHGRPACLFSHSKRSEGM